MEEVDEDAEDEEEEEEAEEESDAEDEDDGVAKGEQGKTIPPVADGAADEYVPHPRTQVRLECSNKC